VEYTRLSDELQAQLRENTLANIESDHFLNTLALQRAEAANDEASREQIQKTLDSLEAQHAALSS
jgi:regulator of replication initiation timing